jgi:hypothetical protein
MVDLERVAVVAGFVAEPAAVPPLCATADRPRRSRYACSGEVELRPLCRNRGLP